LPKGSATRSRNTDNREQKNAELIAKLQRARMRVKFQADADLDGRVLRGLRRAAPEIDIRTAADAALQV